MFSMLLLLNPAHADRALEAPQPPPCEGPMVTFMLPAHGATDLPSLLQPYVGFDAACPGDARVVLLDSQSQTVFEGTHDGFASTGLELPVLDLLPGDYLLRVYGGAGDLVDRAAFTVSGAEAEVPAPPVLHLDASTYGDGWVDFVASVEGAPVPGLVIYGADGDEYEAVSTEAWFSNGFASADGGTGEQCFSARVRGVSDVWSPSTTVCVNPTLYDDEDMGICGVGCSSLGKIPAGGGFLLASLVGLFARRRERLG